MSPQRWRKLESLYDAAAELTPEERARFLDEQCGEDQDLRRQLTAMLRDAGGFTGVVEHAASTMMDGAGWIGQRLGPYRVNRLIGHGGMGAVYEGVREDAFQKRVAIKLVKVSFDSEFARRRFQRERQILARLEHPNIARLLDGGDYDGRVPYLVMEFVEGEQLLTAAASTGVEAKLRLFQKVLSAASFAHRELVVHRDLKPANILVSREGEPKLLDFGIARLVDEDPGAETGRTLTVGSMMTPDYASPEQVKGEPAGVASDIYSLGATLYELLSGARPHALESYSTAEVYHAICETEPRPPSERAPDPKVKRELRGDIDRLVLHALAKDPAARYSSAEAFRSEIDRYLEGRPLKLGRATVMGRGWKFVKRNRLMVGAAVALTVSLIGGVTVSTIQARRAQRRFAQVRELANTFLFQFYDQVTPLSGSTAVRASIVETARKYLDGLAQEAGNDRGLLLELAQAYERLGDVQGRSAANLGQTEEARRNYQRAIDFYARIGVNRASPSDLRRRLARVLGGLGRLEFNAYHEPASDAALTRMLTLVDDAAPDPPTRRVRAAAHSLLGQLRQRQGRISEAVTLFEAARQGLMDLRASGFADPGLAEDIRTARDRAARVKVQSGDLDSALSAYQEMLQNSEPCQEQGPPDKACRNVGYLLERIGDIYAAVGRPNLGEPEKAIANYEQSIRIQERFAATDPNDRQARFDLSVRLGKLGDAVWQSNPRRALALYDRALETARTLASKEQFEDLRSSYLTAISRPLRTLGRLAEARKALVESTAAPVDAQSSYFDRLDDLGMRTNLPPLLLAEGKRAEAVTVLQQVIRTANELRAVRPEDFAPVFMICQSYRALASIDAGQERSDALLRSAAAWRSWPPNSFTRREEQKDLAAARQ